MRRNGRAVKSGNSAVPELMKAERGVLYELQRQPGGGIALLPYSWFRMCLRADKRDRPEFPTAERTLTRCLTRLVKWKVVERIGTPDRAAWYVLPKVWEAMTETAKMEVRSYPMNARGSKATLSILVPGPAGISPELARKVWIPFEDTTHPGTTKYRGPAFTNIREPRTGTLVHTTTPVADAGIRLVSFVFSLEPTGRSVQFEHVA
jgi:hypothetical protein